MNKLIERLYTIAKKENRLIIGLMSGTSLDGLDIALCRIKGCGRQTTLKLLHFETLDYTDSFRMAIRKVFAVRTIDQQQLCGLNALIGITHARLIKEALDRWGVEKQEVDLVASHGQTVYHAPQSLTKDTKLPNSTLQIGDGDHIAVHTGIITVSDFRQKHIAAGGEGAPLAAYGDFLLYSRQEETRVLLNIGGIANFTFLPSGESGQPCFATDVGPGNTMMNQYMQVHFGHEMDRNGKVATSGTCNPELLAALLDHAFFSQPFPKTTGPELFNLDYLHLAQQRSNTANLPKNDVMATLASFSAGAISQAIKTVCRGYEKSWVYTSGGGLHNPLLMEKIKAGIPGISVLSFESLGLLPDAKEAALFALLANETVAGGASHVDGIRDSPAVCMGKISLPE